MKKSEKIIRFSSFAVCEIFAVVTVVLMLVWRQNNRLLLAFATPFIVMLPLAIEKLLGCKMSLPVYLYALFYSIGPALGQCYNFYYTISWWDKMLHISGGVMFAFFGFFLFEKFVGRDKNKVVMAAVFGLCFSMSLAVLWEFCEFGAGVFFGADMQDDVVITEINSYLLGDSLGQAGTIKNIKEVIVNGQKLGVNGYIDIGLIDSMLDMLLETVGALVVSVIYILCKGKWSVFKHETAV